MLDKHYFGLPSDIMVCFCYVIPANSSHYRFVDIDILDQIIIDLANFKEEYQCNFLLTGDFNARTGLLPDYIIDDFDEYLPLPDDYQCDKVVHTTRHNQDTKVNEHGRRLLDLCKMSNLRIVNGHVGEDAGKGEYTCTTYQGQSLVDLVLCYEEMFELFETFKVLPQTELSDHNPIHFSIKLTRSIDSNRSGEHDYVKMVWNNDKAGEFLDLLNGNVCQIKFQEMNDIISLGDDSQESVSLAVDTCVEAIRLAADPLFCKHYNASSHIPKNPNKPEWATADWSESKKLFYRRRDEYRRNPLPSNRTAMVEARTHHKQISFRCRSSHEKNQSFKLEQARKNNIRKYWKMLAHAKGIDIEKPRVTVDDFYQYFLSLSNPDSDFYVADDDVIQEFNTLIENDMNDMFAELNVPLSADEIKRSIKELKSGKSAGDDLVINEFFIHGNEALCTHLTLLFNFVFDSGEFPTSWSDGLLVPIHKKGSLSSPNNYRGITLLSVLGKLFTRTVNNRLNNWAEEYSIYVEAQYGFRKGRSTTDCAFILHTIINKFVQNGKKLFTLFVDFSKAFDYVVRDNLWFKLLKSGVSGKILTIIMSMYQCIRTRIYVNGDKSDYFDCKLGVRQGECLSPFLFALYVNDMEKCLDDDEFGVTVDDIKIILLFYADDVVVISESAQGLQREIDKLQAYCTKWKLKLNTDKSQVVIFQKGNANTNHQWFFGDIRLKVSKRIPYLGIIFASNGSFHRTQLTIADQARKALFIMYRRLQKFPHIKPTYLLQLFDAFIAPILNYGSEVWGFHEAPNIERLHLKFLKQILCVRKQTQNDFVYGELGRFPMYTVRYVRIIKYWLNIIHGKKSLYVNKAYIDSMNMADSSNKPTWARSVKNLLCTTGFAEVWFNQGVPDIGSFISLFKQRITDMFIQNWRGQLDNSSRARFYRTIKPEFSTSKYLDLVECKSHRIALTRFITSSHTLKIETGRWTRPKTPINNRLCQHCINKVEDEFHILTECPLYRTIRQRLISNYYVINPSMYKVVQLLTSSRKRDIISLAKFIYAAFKIHTELHPN